MIGSCLDQPATLQEVRTSLNAWSFSAPSHARLFEIFEALDDAGKSVDALTVVAELRARDWYVGLGDELHDGRYRGGSSYLAHLAELAADHRHAVEWAKRLARLALKRKVTSAAQLVAGEGYAGNFVSDEQFPAWALDEMSKACESRSSGSMASVGEIARDRAVVHAEQWEGKREPWGMSLPWARTHAILHGAGVGEVIFVGALEAGGKSILGEQIALHVAGRKYDGAISGAAILTLEMPKAAIVDRALCHLAGISWRKLQGGYDEDEQGEREPITSEEIGRLNEAHATLADLPLEVDDADKDLARIRQAARQAQARLRARGAVLRLLVVDHVHILDLDTNNYTLALAEVVRGLKRMAVEMGICVVALAQFTQDAGRREGKPHNGDLRDAAAIKQIADKILLIHRPWAKRQDKDSDDARASKDQAEILITKNRNGPLAAIPMRLDGPHFAFWEVDRARTDDAPPQRRPRPTKGPGDRYARKKGFPAPPPPASGPSEEVEDPE